MADLLPWPSVLKQSSEDWSLRGGTRSGGQTFQGNEQVVSSPTARWKATLTIPCGKPEQVRQMRRVIALGRTQLWYVGPYEDPRAPWNIDPLTGGRINTAIGRADDAIDPAYRTNVDTSPNLDFRLAVDLPANATRLGIIRYRGGLILPGMMMSIYGRLHVITAMPTDAPDTGAISSPFAVEVRPWLRAPYFGGTLVEFGKPLCTMRLASDDTGAMELQLSRYGTVTVELVEAF